MATKMVDLPKKKRWEWNSYQTTLIMTRKLASGPLTGSFMITGSRFSTSQSARVYQRLFHMPYQPTASLQRNQLRCLWGHDLCARMLRGVASHCQLHICAPLRSAHEEYTKKMTLWKSMDQTFWRFFLDLYNGIFGVVLLNVMIGGEGFCHSCHS